MSFDYFDRVYCISLPGHGRRDKMRAQFESVGIKNYEFVYAQEPVQGFSMSNMRRNPRGEFGANLSHIKAVARAVEDQVHRPLFVEDDIVFCDDAASIMNNVFLEIPIDWQVLYLGGHPRGKYEFFSDHLAKISTFSFAEAYSLKDWSLYCFLDYWLDHIGQPDAMYDFVLGKYAAETDAAFCTTPLLTEQPPGTYSYIGGKPDDKRNCIKRGWKENLCA